MYARDTIAAVSTPPGSGGIGIIRLSGDDALAIAARLFSPSRPGSAPSHRLRHGRLVDAAGEAIDEILAVAMVAPHTYTGEDIVELHCHGSPTILRRALARCCECGARLAEPGEFTKRAFLNDRIDLVQAEAVAELIGARTEAASRAALRHLSGSLSGEIQDLRDALVQMKARTEVMIDFSEEEVDVTPTALIADVQAASDRIALLLASYEVGRRLREGVHATLLGRPNVGKSSLLNALLGRDRAIVTPTPGTTRDVISEELEIGGVPVVLADTAGVRTGAEEIERLGIERSHQEAARADLLLIVLDRSQPLTADDQAVLGAALGRPALRIASKADLEAAWPLSALGDTSSLPIVEVSARTHQGIDDLRRAIIDLIGVAKIEPHAPIVTLVRHRDALARAQEALAFATESLAAGMAIDAIAVDIQAAVEHMSAITGEITTEEVLDRIFRDFCIGK